MHFKHFAALMCIALGVGLAFLAGSLRENSSAEKDVERTVMEYHDALINRNYALLNDILAEKIRYISSFENGIRDRRSIEDQLRELEGNLESIDTQILKVKVSSSTATVECIVRMNLRTTNPELVVHEALYTYSLESAESRWIINGIKFE